MENSVIDEIVLNSIQKIKNVKRAKKKFTGLLSKADPFELSIKCNTALEIVEYVYENHKRISSKTILGYLYENIANGIVEFIYNGYKSSHQCSDLEWLDNLQKKHYRGWKSSTNWGNSDQIKSCIKKLEEFQKSSDFGSFMVCTSYGKSTKKRKIVKGFIQISGQDAWESISGDSEMYNKVLESITNKKTIIEEVINNIYFSEYQKAENWILENFSFSNKTINYKKINEFISGKNKIEVSKW